MHWISREFDERRGKRTLFFQLASISLGDRGTQERFDRLRNVCRENGTNEERKASFRKVYLPSGFGRLSLEKTVDRHARHRLNFFGKTFASGLGSPFVSRETSPTLIAFNLPRPGIAGNFSTVQPTRTCSFDSTFFFFFSSSFRRPSCRTGNCDGVSPSFRPGVRSVTGRVRVRENSGEIMHRFIAFCISITNNALRLCLRRVKLASCVPESKSGRVIPRLGAGAPSSSSLSLFFFVSEKLFSSSVCRE